MSTMLSGFEKHPDVAKGTCGRSDLVDPEPVRRWSVRQMTTAAQGGGASEKLGVETIRGTDVPNQPRRVRMLRWRRATRQRNACAQAVRKLGAGAPATAELKATVRSE